MLPSPEGAFQRGPEQNNNNNNNNNNNIKLIRLVDFHTWRDLQRSWTKEGRSKNYNNYN